MCRQVRETENFFDSAIAVRRYDQDTTGKLRRFLADPQDGVVMELALLPVIDELVVSPTLADALEQSAEHERLSELTDRGVL